MLKSVNRIREEIESSGAGEQLIAARIAELDEIEQRFNEAIPRELAAEIERPWPSALTVRCVHDMTWRFVKSDGPSYFITSDNPAYFFSSFGLGRREAELTFPISRSLALLGSWTPERGAHKPICDQRLVREVNRRVASGTTRFIFYWRNDEFVRKLGEKREPYLSIIPWERMRCR